MAAKDQKLTKDGTWRATMEAFTINLLAYKAVGTKLVVHRLEKRRSGLFGWWGPMKDTWVERAADVVSISNGYAGLTARHAEAIGLGHCQETQRSSLDCRVWAAGIGVSLTYDAPLGGFPPNPGPSASGTVLGIRAVNGTGFVSIGRETLTLNVEAGPYPPPGKDRQGLTSAVAGVGNRISCVAVDGRGRIATVGGTHDDGTPWRLQLEAAVGAVRAGHAFFVEVPVGDRVEVVVAVGDGGRPYLKTVADGDVPNNLLALPRC